MPFPHTVYMPQQQHAFPDSLPVYEAQDTTQAIGQWQGQQQISNAHYQLESRQHMQQQPDDADYRRINSGRRTAGANGTSNLHGRTVSSSHDLVQDWLPLRQAYDYAGQASASNTTSVNAHISSPWPTSSLQYQLDQYHDTGLDSMASAGHVGVISNASGSIDDLHDAPLLSPLHATPFYEHYHLQQYSQSPASAYGGRALPDQIRQSSQLHHQHRHQIATDSFCSAPIIEHVHSLSHSPQIQVDPSSQQSQPSQPQLQESLQQVSASSTPDGQVPAKRRRGRPKSSQPTSAPETGRRTRPDKPTRRQPHNEIERKYREGLNSEMERLREVIPQISQYSGSERGVRRHSGSGGSSSQPTLAGSDQGTPGGGGVASSTATAAAAAQQKPTKASVIKTAVEEIERLQAAQVRLQASLEVAERERDEFRQQAEILRQQQQQQQQSQEP